MSTTNHLVTLSIDDVLNIEYALEEALPAVRNIVNPETLRDFPEDYTNAKALVAELEQLVERFHAIRTLRKGTARYNHATRQT